MNFERALLVCILVGVSIQPVSNAIEAVRSHFCPAPVFSCCLASPVPYSLTPMSPSSPDLRTAPLLPYAAPLRPYEPPYACDPPPCISEDRGIPVTPGTSTLPAPLHGTGPENSLSPNK